MSGSARAYRALLRCYPPAFRERFGAEMALAFAALLRDAPSRWGQVRLWLAALREAIGGGLRERLAPNRSTSGMRRNSSPPSPLQSVTHDLRFAARALSRRPGFVGTVVLTLALGIGANTAIFSLIDAVLLHPVSVARPESVVTAFHKLDDAHPYEAFPYNLFTHLAEGLRSFNGLAGFHVLDIGVHLGGRVEVLSVAGVSVNFFDVLGLRPQAGRLLHTSDDGPIGATPLVVLSDEAWARFYGRAPDAVGSTIRAGETTYTIIGVAPRQFRGTDLATAPQLWFPITMLTSLGEGGLFTGRRVFETSQFGWVELVGRLHEGAAATAATDELNTRTRAYWRSVDAKQASGRDTLTAPVRVLSLAGGAALGDRDNLVRFVTILSVVVVLTLGLACVNVANLLTIRGTERARELAVRTSLGASQGRLMRQTLLESVLLGLLGAAVATAVGVVTTRLLARFALPGGVAVDRLDLGLNLRVLGFTAGVAMVAALAFGLLPALRAGRVRTAEAFRGHGGITSRGPRDTLVVAQAAISLVLLIGAGLFIRSLRAGLATDLGFDPRPFAAATVDVGLLGYSSERKEALYLDAVAQAGRLPGVEGAAIGSQVPLGRLNRLPIAPIAEAQSGDSNANLGVGLVHVSAEYFDLLGIPLRAGRRFDATDDASSTRVAIVNESGARYLAPGIDILGRQVSLFGVITYTIVGVVRDTKYTSVRDSMVPVMFTPITQPSGSSVHLIVRTSSPRTILPSLVRVFHALDPDVPVRDARLVAQQIDEVLMPQRFGATLLGVLALVALGISAVGIYGVVAYSVSRRVRELGIRIALGAGRPHIVQTITLRSGVAILTGIVIGVLAAAVASRELEQFLYGVTHVDTVAFTSATALLLCVAACACWSPLRRAIRVNPIEVIRSE